MEMVDPRTLKIRGPLEVWVRGTKAGSVALVAVVLGAATAPAAGAVSVGQTFEPTSPCTAPTTILQSGSPAEQYRVQAPGVLTSWSYQAPAEVVPIRFKVGHRVDGETFQVDAQSATRIPVANELNRFTEISISVRTGDLIGLFFEASESEVLCGGLISGYDFHSVSADAQPGLPQVWSPGQGLQLNVAARLEPDADRDGFGDETEDLCPTDSTTPGPCPPHEPGAPSDRPDTEPPETVIVKPAPERLVGHRAKVKFIALEPRARLQCKLDGRRFRRCRSPKWIKRLDAGRHVFKVRAIDQAGNIDPSAAQNRFRVVLN
jgi:hypothetical protein